MVWYGDLYAGKGIGRRKEEIIEEIKENLGRRHIYVLALSANPKNTLEIIHSVYFKQKHYPKEDLFLVGIAKGYDEAVDLAVEVIMEVYKETGGFAVGDFFRGKQDEGGSSP